MSSDYGVRLEVVRPFTVLVTELGTGAFLVQDCETGATAYVQADDASMIRDALNAAFGGAGRAMNIPPIVKPRV